MLCLEDAGEWRNEAVWPPTRVQQTPMYLADGGQLATTAPTAAATSSYDFRPSVGITSGRRGLGSTTPWAMPIDQRLDEAYSVLFTTDALTRQRNCWANPRRSIHRIDCRGRVFPREAVRCRARRNVTPDHRWWTAGNASQLARGTRAAGSGHDLRTALYPPALRLRDRSRTPATRWHCQWRISERLADRSAGATTQSIAAARTRRTSCCRSRPRWCVHCRRRNSQRHRILRPAQTRWFGQATRSTWIW